MKKNRLITMLLIVGTILGVIPFKIVSKNASYQKTFNDCNVPGINSLLFFPFGQKSDDLKIECIQKGFSSFEIISFELPIDREDIGRLELPQISLTALLGDSAKILTEMIILYSENKELKDLTIIPKLLFFKKNMHTIIGIELCFPQAEQKILNIERIALFFIQNITRKDSDEGPSLLGFNRLALYNADDLNNKIIIIGETHEQKQEIHALLESAFKNIMTTHTGHIESALLSIIKSVIESLAESTIGLVIEEVDGMYNKLTEYHALENITSALLTDKEYLFYDPTNKAALALVEVIQKNKMPLTTNYYLYGSIMGYHEKHIMLKYQLEAYLRSISSINADGTVRWPYNIPKWLKKNKENIDQWVHNKWNAPFHFFYPKERRHYEYDKKKAQKYLKHIL